MPLLAIPKSEQSSPGTGYPSKLALPFASAVCNVDALFGISIRVLVHQETCNQCHSRNEGEAEYNTCCDDELGVHILAQRAMYIFIATVACRQQTPAGSEKWCLWRA